MHTASQDGMSSQIQSTPPSPQELEFGSFPSCLPPASSARFGDEVTIRVPPMQQGLLLWRAPRPTTALLSQERANVGHPVGSGPSLRDPGSSSFVCGFIFLSCIFAWIKEMAGRRRGGGGVLRFDFSVGTVCFGSHLRQC